MTFYYRYLLDVNRDYSFTGSGSAPSDISVYVKKASWQFGLASPYELLGNGAYMEVVLDNRAGDFMLEVTSARYYGKVRNGTMLRAQMSTNGSSWTNMTTLKIQQIVPTFVDNGDHEVTLKCGDITANFLNQDFVAPLQTDVTTDQILDKLFETAKAIWPYESYYQFIGHTSIGDGKAPYYGPDWTDFETGETTFPYFGDNLDRGQGVKIQQYLKDAMGAEGYGIFFFSPRSEKFKFFSRYHASDTATSWNITEKIMNTPQYSFGRDLVNDYTLSYAPRAVGTAHSVIYSSDNAPFQINARDTKTITLRYRDPNNESASVGALAVDDLVSGTDYIANSASDGSGTDWTQYIIPTLIKGAASSQLILYNRKYGDPAYITTLQLRGTPITAYNKEIVTVFSDDSIYGLGSDESTGNDRKAAYDSLPGISDDDFAQAYADFRVNANSQPQQVLERLSISVKTGDSATETQVLARTVGDTINVSDSITGHNTDYMIVAEAHNPATEKNLHTVSYLLRPTNRGSLFIVGVSTSNGGDLFSF